MMTTEMDEIQYPEEILKECVRQMYSKIVASFDPKEYILDALFEKGTVTSEEKKHIESLPERRSAALVDLLYNCQRPDAISKFLKILSNDEKTTCRWIPDGVHKLAQEKVASSSSLGSEIYSVPVMTAADDKYEDILRQCLKQIYTRIVASVDSKGYISDSLFARGILTMTEKHEFEDSPGQRRAIIEWLFTCRRPNAISHFLNILSSSNEPAWNQISKDVFKAADMKLASMPASFLGSERNELPMDQEGGTSTSIQTSKAPIDPVMTQKFQNYDEVDLENCLPLYIIRGFREVQSKGPDLEDYIDPENGLLTRLYNQRIIDYSETAILQKLTPYQVLNGELLMRIDIKMNSISKQFIQALCQDDQVHIAKFIVTAGCETDSDERLLPRELRTIIDVNMFCLEKLIDTEKRDLELKLVAANCITPRHRERVIRSKPENKAHELLIILQRRRYKDFFNFMECLRKTMHNNIVKILEKGGVTEIKVQLLQERSDKRKIEADLIKKRTGYVDQGDGNDLLSEDQKETVSDLLATLAEEDIYFIGTCTETSSRDIHIDSGLPMDSSLPMDTGQPLDSGVSISSGPPMDSGLLSLFFQGEQDNSFTILENRCESGSLKDTIEILFRFLLNIRDEWPPLVKSVTTGKHSSKHQLITETEQNTGIVLGRYKKNEIRS